MIVGKGNREGRKEDPVNTNVRHINCLPEFFPIPRKEVPHPHLIDETGQTQV